MSDPLPRGSTRQPANFDQAGADRLRTQAEARAAELEAIAVAYATVFRPNPKNPVDPVAIVMADLRRRAFADRTTFIQGQPDQTAVNEGRRQLFVHIEERVRAGNDVTRGTGP